MMMSPCVKCGCGDIHRLLLPNHKHKNSNQARRKFLPEKGISVVSLECTQAYTESMESSASWLELRCVFASVFFLL